MPDIKGRRHKEDTDKFVWLGVDKKKLSDTGGLCRRASDMLARVHPEFSAQLNDASNQLIEWSEMEPLELNKPF